MFRVSKADSAADEAWQSI